ncbi:hypothetical protein, partial [Saccharothrix violaceirubra]
RVWDVVTGECVVTLSGHQGLVWGVAFGPDGSRVASASHDGSVRVWDVVVGDPVWLATQFSDGSTASWSPTEDRLLDTTEGAWRYLRAACYDDHNRLLGLQPHELYYAQPNPNARP